MHFKRILIVLMVVIFMTGTFSAKAATTVKAAALEPWDSEVVDKLTGGYVGSHVSIAHYSGRAYVSYYDATNHDLKLAYQVDPGTGNCPGNLDWKCSTVDNGGPTIIQHDVGQYNSIDIFTETVYLTASPQGELEAQPPHYHYAKIGISYYDATDLALKFAVGSCNDATVCSWTKTVVDDDPGEFIQSNKGLYSSFKFGTDGTPVIYYHAFNGLSGIGGVKRAVQLTPITPITQCNSSWTCEIVAQSDTSVNYGTFISADGGRVVFYDPTNFELVMARSTGSIMSSTCGQVNYWDCDVIDSTNHVGKFASLYYDAVHPMQIAYYDATNGRVKYAISTTAGTGNCPANSDFNCYYVDNIGVSETNPSIGISLTLDAQGLPVIAYQDFSEEFAPTALMIARPSTVYGELVGNCGAVPPGYLFSYWKCSLLDRGPNPDVNVADFAAVSVSPAGLATVAYYEADDYYLEGRLKVTQQHFTIFLPILSK